ncbi:hypothetical protein [Deinococcus hopiensis]|uniref:hypothetical protein n=1 Tax=Deinococcus hopiensis TaxID=309885 RepID=UPI00111C1878|nr:hypothetical protein [Deinococcus hopiensis]
MNGIFKSEVVQIIDTLRRVKWSYRFSNLDDQMSAAGGIASVPIIAFRLYDDDVEFLRKLRWVVRNFQGYTRWTLEENLTKPSIPIITIIDYVLFIEKRGSNILDIKEQALFSKHNQELIINSYNDISYLTRLISKEAG